MCGWKPVYGLDVPAGSPQAMCGWKFVYELNPQQVLHKRCVGGNLCMGWTDQQVLHKPVNGLDPPVGSPQACVWAEPPSRFSTSYVWVETCELDGSTTRFSISLCIRWMPQQVLHKPVYGLDPPVGSPQACVWAGPPSRLSISYVLVEACEWVGSTSRLSTSYVLVCGWKYV